MTTAIVWFRRDLRLHDHPALAVALASHQRVVPLFVVDPRLALGRFASPNRMWFLLESVRSLGERLAERGAGLVVRVGDPRMIVPEVAAAAAALDVYVSRDHGPYGRTRDATVAAALDRAGIAFHAKRGGLVHEPEDVLTSEGRPFSIYAPFRRAWTTRPRRAVLPAPDRLQGHDLGLGRLPDLAELGLGDGPTADSAALPEGGEPAARERLETWVARGLDAYATTRDRPDLATGTSRLSPDLHLGLLSALEVVERAAGDDEARRVFANELVWREFYAHILFHRPELRWHAFQPAYETVGSWGDDAGFDAWRTGQTGYPVVDAAMRQLLVTGWMHNRAQMISASFLTKDLGIDWRRGEAHFMRHLVDGDLASNNGGWQWSASTGTDPQPYFRVFNPVTQARRFDPAGDYVRRWVPELARVPDERIHAPWELDAATQAAAGCVIGVDYPAPIVDHAQARVGALARYEAARRTS